MRICRIAVTSKECIIDKMKPLKRKITRKGTKQNQCKNVVTALDSYEVLLAQDQHDIVSKMVVILLLCHFVKTFFFFVKTFLNQPPTRISASSMDTQS